MRALQLMHRGGTTSHIRAAQVCPADGHSLFAQPRFALSTAVAVPVHLVKQLRELTGAPMIECKSALVAAGDGGLAAAVDFLRAKGLAAASRKAGRVAAQGLVAVAVAEAGDRGAIVELNSETDFVARNALFQSFAARAAATALAALPPVGASVASAAVPTPGATESVTLLASSPVVGEGEGGAASGSVGEGVTDVIAKVRENIVLRRAASLAVPGGIVSAYVHNALAPGLGGVGVLVGLRLAAGGGAAAPRGKGKTASAAAAAAPPLPSPPALTPQPLTPAHPSWPLLAAIARKVGMHIAAARPLYLNRADVPPAALERERAVLLEQSKVKAGSGSGSAPPKSEAMQARIMEGRLAKFYGETVLGEQTWVLGGGEGGDVRVDKWLALEAAAVGAPPVEIAGFSHFAVGDGQALE